MTETSTPPAAQEPSEPPPSYLPLLALYAAALTISTTGVVRSERTLPERPAPGDLALLAVAAHQVARVLARHPVAGPLRDLARGPFAHSLVSPRRLTLWSATGLSFSLVIAPRQTRLAATILTVMAAADALEELRD